MRYSKRLNNDLKAQRKREIRLEARTNKELDNFCLCYRDWVAGERKARRKPKTIIAEGDSWFRYPLGLAVISQLERLLNIEILNLAKHGDETKDMLSMKQKARLIRELEAGPTRRTKYDYLLFSGGGNDLVGIDRFHKWLHPYQSGMGARDVINFGSLRIAFRMLELNYRELIELRNTHSINTKLVFHEYDFIIPDGRTACGRGPWVKPGLNFRMVPEDLRREVVTIFLKEFARLLKKIAKNHNNIIVVNTQGTLVDSDWANELHPRNKGFRKIAERFAAAL